MNIIYTYTRNIDYKTGFEPKAGFEDKLIVLGLHFRPQVVSEAYEI